MLKNMKRMIITSLLILLPIPVGLALQSRFPAGLMDAAFMTVWMPPLSLLAGHWVCALFTSLDSGNKNRNRKVQNLVLWIMPLTSWFCAGLMYALYLGLEFSVTAWSLLLMGIIFAAIGNYLPKTKMNHTIGVKVVWAYSSEENWNATHRFAGKLWVIGGILMMLCGFLPNGWAVALMFCLIFPMVIIPIIYSWWFYKKELAEGKDVKASYSKTDKRILKWSAVFLAVISLFVAAILFTGDMEYTLLENSLAIKADWYTDMVIRYETIEKIEYREGKIPGLRVGGFGSFRLLMGYFKNDEFGTHIRYTYYNPEACIVLTTDRQTYVLSGKTAEETHMLYQDLLAHCNN